jgi:hypothetical protein
VLDAALDPVDELAEPFPEPPFPEELPDELAGAVVVVLVETGATTGVTITGGVVVVELGAVDGMVPAWLPDTCA